MPDWHTVIESSMASRSLICVTDQGLFCERGGFYIDPWRKVNRAIITHAHADHARRGQRHYLAPHEGRHVLQTRMGASAKIDTVDYGEVINHNGVKVSLHPAGHVLGSAQIRVEYAGEVWVVSGDYKVIADQTCTPFEPVKCHTFITECTFGLPVYRWVPQDELFTAINQWWRLNRDEGRVSVIYAYSLGKAQRVLAGLDETIAPIYCHGAVERCNKDYRETGIDLPPTQHAGLGEKNKDWDGAMVIAPPSAGGTPWLRKFGDVSTAFASGWMLIRGSRRRRAVDRGFVVSDHADWDGLIEAIDATEADRVLATHGRTGPMVRFLRERGLDADSLQTEYVGESDDVDVDSKDDAFDETGSGETAGVSEAVAEVAS